jgi:hypothetical protein
VANSKEVQTCPAPSRFRPRFTLAALLALVTLSSLGAWYWWRVPFEVESAGLKIDAGTEFRIVSAPKLANPAGSAGDPFAAPHVSASGPTSATDPFAAPASSAPVPSSAVSDTPGPVQMVLRVKQFKRRIATRVETVRRVWGGKTLRHGPLIELDENGQKVSDTPYEEGMPHGLTQKWFADGHLREQGQHHMGRKQGEWVRYYQRPSHDPPRVLYSKNVTRWSDGIPEGKWEWIDPQGQHTLTMEFAKGKLTGPLPPEAEIGLARRLAEGKFADAELVHKLVMPSSGGFRETPLKDALDFLEAQHAFPLEIDARRLEETGIRIDIPISLTVPSETPYIVALGRILRPLNLTCDYRYGVLYVTTPEAYESGDLTGISQIAPLKGSLLAEVWDAPVSIEFLETPLPMALEYIAEQTTGRLRFDASHLPKDFDVIPVTRTLSGLSLRHMLGAILDDLNLRCELDGETIVLKPR